MPRGAPDYSNVRTIAPVHLVSDMGEVVVRLGSPVSFDRAGNVILIDSFEHGLDMWFGTSPVSDGGHRIISTYKRTGAYAAEFTPSSDGDYFHGAVRYVAYPRCSSVGAEFSFTVTTKTEHMVLLFQVYDGSLYHRIQLRYDHTNAELQYLSSGLAWVTLAEVNKLSMGDRLFHTLKVVANIDDHQYTRVVLNSQEFYPLALSYYTSASALSPYLATHVQIYATDSSQPLHYVDDLIITINEQ